MKRKSNKKSNFRMLILLILLAVFLIMSTYAWFTSNRVVKINPIDVTIDASEGFQISADAINWKTVMNASEFTSGALDDGNLVGTYVGHVNQIPAKMDPISTSGRTNATSGLMDMFLGLVDTDDNNNYMLTAEQQIEKQGGQSFIAFDLFFRTNNDMVLALDIEASVTDNGTGPTAGKGIENAARVAFVQLGALDYATYGSSPSPTTAQGLHNALGPTDGSNTVIWEPNYLSHTQLSVTDMYNIFGVSGNISDPFWTSIQVVDGIYADIEDTDEVKLIENNATDNTDFFEPVSGPTFVRTAADRKTNTNPAENGPKTLGIPLVKGITKIRIYMWLEGQDWDCRRYSIRFRNKMEFSINKSRCNTITIIKFE